jgi:hypothetical protein
VLPQHCGSFVRLGFLCLVFAYRRVTKRGFGDFTRLSEGYGEPTENATLQMFHMTATGAMSDRYTRQPELMSVVRSLIGDEAGEARITFHHIRFEMLSHDKTGLCFGNDFSG